MKRHAKNFDHLNKALSVAQSSLVACCKDIGIIAGCHHFVDLWARDSLFATFGANAVGLSAVSQKTIEMFLAHQRSDGLVPFLIRRSKLTVGKYFGKHAYYKTPRPQFRSSQSGGIVSDGGLMTVIAARNYAETTHDGWWLQRHYDALSKAMMWYQKKFGRGLIHEWFQCEWQDSILKLGTTLYTNVLYFKALGDMSYIAGKVRKPKEAKDWKELQQCTRDQINRRLWNGEFFADWKNVFRHDYFSSHGNMLAIVFGLASNEQARSILSYAHKYCLNGFTLETNYPRYPLWRISVINYLSGTPDYQNRGCLWLQPGILFALSLHKLGETREARQVLAQIAAKIKQYRAVYEVYEKSGQPVRRLLYQSEHPFAWSAGLFLWAYRILIQP